MNYNISEFTKKIFKIILPITFQQFMLALVSASDALMLGLVSQDALSAVSLAGQLTFVENLFLAAMSIGLSMLAAQYWGKRDRNSIEDIFAYVMKITSLISLVFFAVSLFVPGTLMKIFTSDELLIKYGVGYLRTVSLSFLLAGISQIYLTILKNTGKAVLVMAVSTFCVIINIILNAVFIFGLFGMPRMEVEGAALATVISWALEVALCIIITHNSGKVKLRLNKVLNINKALRGDFLKYTMPILGNQIVWGLGFTMYSVIMGHLGTDAVASNSIANIVKNLVVCFCIGLSNGGAIIVGNELGAGRLERAKLYGHKLTNVAIIYGIIAGIIMISLSPIIVNNISLSDMSKYYLRWMIILCAIYMVAKSVNTTLIAGIFCAGGDSKFGFICDTITMWAFSVPLGFLAAFVFNLPVLAVFAIINLDEVVKLPAVYKHYKKYNWVRDLTVKNA